MKAARPIPFLQDISHYYADTVAQHGTTPKGVDWNGPESQRIRFQQLLKIIDTDTTFSINDVGCGYGALLGYLREGHRSFEYCGVDLTPAMIEAARKLYNDAPSATFELGTRPSQARDYSVASGIFSVCLATAHSEWKEYVKETLELLDAVSSLGFAFNCLTSYSDREKRKPHLYYADPCEIFDFCKRRFSSQVALLHDYGLYEFTILVRKRS